MKKSAFYLAATIGLVLQISAYADASITRLKVMNVNDNAGNVVSIRLNEDVNRKANPLAYDAEIDCDVQGHYVEIRLRGVPARRSSSEEYVFYEFDYYPECFELQKTLKKKFKANETTCLKVENGWLSVNDESDCD